MRSVVGNSPASAIPGDTGARVAVGAAADAATLGGGSPGAGAGAFSAAQEQETEINSNVLLSALLPAFAFNDLLKFIAATGAMPGAPKVLPGHCFLVPN